MVPIKTIAWSFFSGLVLMAVGGLVSANVRAFATRYGWDQWLSRFADLVPSMARQMIAGWEPLKQRWWLWLGMGLSGGLALALTITPDLPKIISTLQNNSSPIAPIVPGGNSTCRLGPLPAKLLLRHPQFRSSRPCRLTPNLDIRTKFIGLRRVDIQKAKRKIWLILSTKCRIA